MTSIPSSGRAPGFGGERRAGRFPRYNHIMGNFAVVFARIAGTLAFLALLGAWAAAMRGGTFLGFTEQHLFNDAIVLSLFAIAGLLDTIVHRQAAGEV